MERLHYIDVAKGILISILIISHFGIVLKWNNFDSSNYFSPVFFFLPCFNCFFMQCFFFITGFCSTFEIDHHSFFSKLFKQLIVPTIFFGLLQGIMFRYANEHVNTGYKGGYFTLFWFLNSLIFAKTFVYLSNKYLTNIYMVLMISFVTLLIGIFLNQYNIGDNIFNVRHGLIACFYVALGYTIKNKSKIITGGVKRYLWILFPCIMILCYLKGWIYGLPGQDANINVNIADIPIFIMITTLGTHCFLKVCKYFRSNICIEYLGKNSLIIYCLHIVPLSLIVKFLLMFLQPYDMVSGMMFLITTLVLELGIMLLFIMILSKKPFCYLFGKWK